MSTITIISALIVLLATLVCYAFVYQTLQHRREQRARLLAALKARGRSFKYVLTGCPEGFLPRELTILVQRSLIDVLQQLSRLEPRESSYPQDLQVLNAQLQQTQRQTGPAKSVSLQNHQQIKEARVCLEELHRFIFHQEARKALPQNQAEAYRNQIRHLVLQITVDGYTLNGMAAKQKDKNKLALHYYELALNLLIREQRGHNQQNSIERLRALVEELRIQVEKEEAHKPGPDSAEQEVADEWSKFGEEDEFWKKKKIYD